MDKKIRVLQVTIGDGNYGGVSSFLYTYYRHMNRDKISFDFLYCGENSMQSRENDKIFDESKITSLKVLKARNNGLREYITLIRVLKDYFDKNTYDIVHVNSSNPYVNACVACVLKKNCAYIAHSHNVQSSVIYSSKLKHYLKSVIRNILRVYIVNKADALYACSDKAGEYLFGVKGCQNKKFEIINNAIDTSQFRFDNETRNDIRRQSDTLDDIIVVGFVGRLSDQKNPCFALSVFKRFHELNPKSELWIIGEGNLKEEMLKKIIELDIYNSVIFFGVRNDVYRLMQGMDILIFPSIFEGLGIVAIEAACSGLPIVASDRIPLMADVIGHIAFLSLNSSLEKWCTTIMEQYTRFLPRTDASEAVKNKNYDIQQEAERLALMYSDLCAGQL